MKIFLLFLIVLCISTNADQDADDIECGVCTKVVSDVLRDLKGSYLEDDMKNAFGQLCLTFPSILFDSCNEFVGKYANELIEILPKETYPPLVCNRLKVCEES